MFGRSTGSIQLARVFGIRVGVDWSWFAVLFLFIFILSGSFRDALDSSGTTAYVVAVASALLFFASLVLHELGHALAARREGIGIAGIDLWFFGGIAKMTRDTPSAGAEFRVAVAGPVVTLLVVAGCVGAGIGLSSAEEFWEAATLDRGATVTPALLLLSWLATINAALFVFNLVPAFPLDGGRIARAIAWRITGDRTRATRFSARLGQGFGYLLMGLGIVQLTAGGGVGGGLWMLVLGLFLSQAAGNAVAQSAVSARLESVRVSDVMDAEPVSMPAETSVERAVDEFFLRYRWPWFGVVDAGGRFAGIVREERARASLEAGEGARPVSEIVEPGGVDLRVDADESVEVLLGSEQLRSLGALFAVDRDGVLRGVVTLEQVRRALASAVTGVR